MTKSELKQLIRECIDEAQQIRSSKTSLPKNLPTTYKVMAKVEGWIDKTGNPTEKGKGKINFDIGGGRSDQFNNKLTELGVTNIHTDANWLKNTESGQYEENMEKAIADLEQKKSTYAGKADTVSVNNVLNVIDDDDTIKMVVNDAFSILKSGGKGYFKIYEGNTSGQSAPTSNGYQRNQKTEFYIPFVSSIFGDVKKVSDIIIAIKK